MIDKPQEEPSVAATKTLVGTVDKIIPSIGEGMPEKAQISVEGGEHLYREIRVENDLEDKDGNAVALKKGSEVEVTITAEAEAVTKK